MPWQLTRSLTPANEVVEFEWSILAKHGHGDARMEQQSFDEHPIDARQRRVEFEHKQTLAQPVLREWFKNTI